MYKTKKLLKWIDEEVIKYSKYLEIVPPVMCYTKNDWVKVLIAHYPSLPIKIKKYVELHTKSSIALAEKESHSVLLFANHIDDKTILEHVIVHELCHLRYWGIEHGKKFSALISKTIKECKGE